jgi:hypothetical protein
MGWPATYACPSGLMWQPGVPIHRCVEPLAFGDSSWGITCPDGVPYRDAPFNPPYCVFCPPGLTPAPDSSACVPCPPGTFERDGACSPKADLVCPSNYTRIEMGPSRDDACVPPHTPHPRLPPLVGFRVASTHGDGWYTPCGEPPPFAVWAPACVVRCLYSSTPDRLGNCPPCSHGACPAGFDRPLSNVYTGTQKLLKSPSFVSTALWLMLLRA